MSRPRKIVLWTIATLTALTAIATIAGFMVIRSQWFSEQVRARIIAEVEKATGGRPELENFQFDWQSMQAGVSNFTLHTKELAGDPAFFRAGRVIVGLTVLSVLEKKVDLASLTIERPEVHIIVFPDGTTNLPSPKTKSKGTPIDNFLKLKIRHYEIRQGVFEFRQDRVPFDIRGDNLAVSLDYDPQVPAYRGHVASRQLHIQAPKLLPLIADFDTNIALDKDQLQFSKVRLAWKESHVEASGTLRDWSAPHLEADVRSSVSLSELGDVLHFPIEHRGEAAFIGKVTATMAPRFTYSVRGHLTAHGLAARIRDVIVSPIGLQAEVHVTPAGVTASRFAATLLGGSATGVASIPEFKRFKIEAATAGLELAQLTQFTTRKPIPWSGVVSGPVNLSGAIGPDVLSTLMLSSSMTISAAPGPVPVQGFIEASYDFAAAEIRLGTSRISTPSTNLTVSGTLGQRLDVNVQASSLSDVLPALALISDQPPKELPLTLDRGPISISASINGPLDNPKIAGIASAVAFTAQNRHFANLSADFTLTRDRLTAANLTVDQAAIHATGSAGVTLVNWQLAEKGPVQASLNLTGIDVRQLAADSGHPLDISGAASASVDLSGTLEAPRAAVQLTSAKPAAFGEQFDQIRASLRYAADELVIVSSDLRMGQARLTATGTYTHRADDWTIGQLRFNAASTGLRIEQIHRVQEYHKGLNGQLAAKAAGAVEFRKGDFEIASLEGELAFRALALDQAQLGNLTATAHTSGDALAVAVSGNLRDSRLSGAGQWKLQGDYPGRGEFRFTPITFATLRSIAAAAGEVRDLPFQGLVDGQVILTGPLKKPDALTAEISLTRFEMTPNPDQRPRAGVRPQDIVLRNSAPVKLTANTKSLDIRAANFTATNTTLDVAGRVGFDDKSAWDLKINGSLNLGILQMLQPDLLAKGAAAATASITGTLKDPQVNGRLELRDASLYLGDITAGVDNANGVVTFDRNRANIEKLTAEVGGGKLSFGGFIGFNSGLLIYRVQAVADQVRVRYPEGVSVTVNSTLALTGTSQSSLVAGAVTVIRAGFTPKADLGSLLSQTAQPISAPAAPNEYLRNIQLDVRIESGPSLQFQTSLTRDLQAEADLHLRGSAAHPALTGEVSANEGEVTVFGNKYTINHGSVRFLNPNRIEPNFELDLETKARGITVNIALNGTPSKVNMTYRSDPPLQTSEIVALLAVGRDPATAAGLAAGQVTSNSFLESGTGVIGQALSTPVTSRLQRFFGVSHLRIDPQLTGVENIPQARLTLEQQVRRDLTLTYITNLTRTAEQLVRVQWDISKEWSAIAVREENGSFGIDFQYRKRFK